MRWRATRRDEAASICRETRMSAPAKRRKPPGPKPRPEPSAERIDPVLVGQIADLLASRDLTEIEVQHGDLWIRVSRAAAGTAQPAPAVPAAIVAPPANPASPPPLQGEHPGAIKSPMVGTVYRRASPEAKPFFDIGSQVKAGEKILLVEAMKTFNEIVAPRAGTITAILVEDGQPVEYGQPLVIIE
jgi:acetyl-CoA carboxylase biotin carboxyl carrier protein